MCMRDTLPAGFLVIASIIPALSSQRTSKVILGIVFLHRRDPIHGSRIHIQHTLLRFTPRCTISSGRGGYPQTHIVKINRQFTHETCQNSIKQAFAMLLVTCGEDKLDCGPLVPQSASRGSWS
ncbi:hypothetical protein QL093DRAFT_1313298 [Fusarium oxysporum]|nr:hypothetical protein QL093DRAFT_1313298 [Fusarium oxysporum]